MPSKQILIVVALVAVCLWSAVMAALGQLAAVVTLVPSLGLLVQQIAAALLALHLLQSALVHVNTLLLQDILSEEKWQKRLTEADRRALSPLFWTHVNPDGRFELDMNSPLDLAAATAMVRTASDTQTPEPAAESAACSGV
jgi:Tn3 transposase DDE domain-containing protein